MQRKRRQLNGAEKDLGIATEGVHRRQIEVEGETEDMEG